MTLRAFYGGTFDPVHLGHLAIARAAHQALGCTIRMMPAADPPHRAPPGAGAEDRAAMLELAIRGQPGLRIDRRELAREGRSYSIDTVHELRRQYGPDAALVLLVGADSFIDLPNWKDWRDLLEAVHFVVAERPGSSLDDDLRDDGGPDAALGAAVAGRWSEDPAALQATPAGRIYRLRQPLYLESASEIRQRIAAGEPWRQLLPEIVAQYIADHNLYGIRDVHPASL